jgi:hypothetical protein
MSAYLPWEHAPSSPAYRARIARLTALAAGEERSGYSRTTGPLTECAFIELVGLARKHRHVDEYVAGCLEAARLHLGHERAAGLVHEDVRRGRFPVRISGNLASAASITGPAASGLAAWQSGASWYGSSDESRRRNHYVRADEYADAYRVALEKLRRSSG